MKQKYVWSIILAIILVIGCKDSKKTGVEAILSEMKSRPIDLCLEKMVCRYGNRDTVISDKRNYDYKMVVYMDTAECSPCRISDLFLWNDYIDKKSAKTKYYFIFSIKKEDMANSYLALADAEFHDCVYFDTCQVFEKCNKQIPQERLYHTFLLDAKNRIVMVGNPIENSELRKIFYKITKE